MSAIYTGYSVKISCIYYLLLGLSSKYDPSTKNIEDLSADSRYHSEIYINFKPYVLSK